MNYKTAHLKRNTTMTFKTAYIGCGDLQNLRVVYSFLDNDEGEVWAEVEEVYIGESALNMVEYLNDQVVENLMQQCIFIETAGA